MIKKFDVYIKADKAYIYPRGEVAECGELPFGEPLHVMNEEEDWWGWCDSQNDPREALKHDDIVRKCKKVCSFPSVFKDDVLKKAQKLMDEYREEGEAIGWGKCEIDHTFSHTYRRSAAWKDEPFYYTFNQSLKWTERDPNFNYSIKGIRVRDKHVQLWGMADALYELGLNLVFTSDFKLHLFGGNTEWKCEYEN